MNRQERRALQTALEATYSGDQTLEAGAVADRLEDAGWEGLRPARVAVAPEDTSTRRLPRMANP